MHCNRSLHAVLHPTLSGYASMKTRRTCLKMSKPVLINSEVPSVFGQDKEADVINAVVI